MFCCAYYAYTTYRYYLLAIMHTTSSYAYYAFFLHALYTRVHVCTLVLRPDSWYDMHCRIAFRIRVPP